MSQKLAATGVLLLVVTANSASAIAQNYLNQVQQSSNQLLQNVGGTVSGIGRQAGVNLPALPQALPPVVPHTVQQTVPQILSPALSPFGPQALPQALPQAFPQVLPQALPQFSSPNFVPNFPTSSVGTLPSAPFVPLNRLPPPAVAQPRGSAVQSLNAVVNTTDATRMLYRGDLNTTMPGVRPGARVNEMMSNSSGVVLVPDAGSSISQTAGSIKVDQGRALISPRSSKGVVVETEAGKLWVGKGASVIVSQERGVMRVKNLNGVGNVSVKLNDARKSGGKKWVALSPGYEFVTSQAGLKSSDISPADGVARRNSTIASDDSFSVSEVFLPSVLKNNGIVKAVRRQARGGSGNQLQAAQVVDEVVKMAAVLDVTRGSFGFQTVQPLADVVDPVLSTLNPVVTTVTGIPLLAELAPPAVPVATSIDTVAGTVGGSIAGTLPAQSSRPAGGAALDARATAVQFPAPTAAAGDAGGGLQRALIAPAVALASVPTDVTSRSLNQIVPRALSADHTKVRQDAMGIANRQLGDSAKGADVATDVAADADSPPALQPLPPVAPRRDETGARRTLIAANGPAPRIIYVLPSTPADFLDTHAMGRTARDWIRQNTGAALLIAALMLMLVAFSAYQWRRTNLRERQLALSVHNMESLNKQLQEARDQAIEASRLKSEFVANISHEIRTPVTAVLGMNDLLLDTKLNAQQREYTRLAKDSAQSLLIIINDLLDFSKMESGKLELETVDVSVPHVMQDALNILSPAIHDKQLMAVFAPSISSGALQGDPVRLRQIILNLAGNAVKFTSKGEVVVAATSEEISAGRSRLTISVKDTGIGISADAISHLAQPFVQADGSTTRRFGGTGLGLSITKRLAELMGGGIEIESQPGEGSSFSCSVVLNSSPGADSEGAQAFAPPAVSGIKVTLLTKQALTSAVLAQALTDAGATIMEKGARKKDVIIFDAAAPPKRFPSGAKLIAIGTAATAPDGLKYDLYLPSPINALDVLAAVAKLKGTEDGAAESDADKLAVEAVPTVANAAVPAKQRILVAEDSPVLQKIVRASLEKLGYAVEIAADGTAAVEAAARGSYDLILMDWQMPVMGGLEATGLIREQESQKGTHTPIIAMTANAMQGHKEACLAAGMDDYLSKPFNQTQLQQLLERWLAG